MIKSIFFSLVLACALCSPLMIRAESMCHYEAYLFLTIDATTGQILGGYGYETLECYEISDPFGGSGDGTGGGYDGSDPCGSEALKENDVDAKTEDGVLEFVKADLNHDGVIEDGEEMNLTDAGMNAASFLAKVQDRRDRSIQFQAGDFQGGRLVVDLNGDGVIDNVHELLFNHFTVGNQLTPNGAVALAQYDHPERGGNQDAFITEQDEVWPSLAVWFDDDQNGIAGPEELINLDSLGIVAVEAIPRARSVNNIAGYMPLTLAVHLQNGEEPLLAHVF